MPVPAPAHIDGRIRLDRAALWLAQSSALLPLKSVAEIAPVANRKTLFDYAEALELASGKTARLKRILAAFVVDAPKRLASFAAALTAQDATTAEWSDRTPFQRGGIRR